MKLLALSGSLRSASVNSAVLRTAQRLAPPSIEVWLFAALGDLPLYNPDLEEHLPAAAKQLRREVAAADALVIASPEYAHGVTGTIKNALDWLVAYEGFAHKPVAVLNASPRARHADAALRETLTTMSAILIEPASVTLLLPSASIGEEELMATPEIVSSLKAVLAAIEQAVNQSPGCHLPDNMRPTSRSDNYFNESATGENKMFKKVGNTVINTKHRASCHCGSVELELDLPDGIVDPRRCDCSLCRRKGAIMASVPRSGIRIVKGEEVLRLYQFNTMSARHYFCSICGIYTHHQRRSMPDQYGYNVGCLEGVNPFELEQVPTRDGVNHPADRTP